MDVTMDECKTDLVADKTMDECKMDPEADKTMDECKMDLVADKTMDECKMDPEADKTMDDYQTDQVVDQTGLRHVVRYNKYKILLVCSVLVFILLLCFIVQIVNVIVLRRSRESGTCPDSSRTIWIPRKRSGNHGNNLDDKSRFYCQEADHKLSHLIDFLVVANRSTFHVPDQMKSTNRMWIETKRPATKILHHHGIPGTRSPKTHYRYSVYNENEVKVLENGSVEIQQDGVYNVYSIVTFVHTPSDTGVPNDTCSICRVRHSDVLDILSDSVAITERVVTESYTAIDLSGNFDLKKGDILIPVIRNVSSVYSFTPANYWGVYQVKPNIHSVKVS